MGCCDGYCKKCHGMILGLFGVLVLINAFVWPRWIGTDGWIAFFAVLMILTGIWKSFMPTCGCQDVGNCCKDTPVAKKKK